MKEKRNHMTKEQFEQFEQEDLPCALFHVMSDDINSETGAKCEEQILVEMLAANPWALAHKPLKYWVDSTVGKCYKDDVKKANEEVLRKQIKNNK